MVRSRLSALVIEDVADDGAAIRDIARPRHSPVPCAVCAVATREVHGYHFRTVADVPVDGRQVVARVRMRCMVCQVLVCWRQTFRKQVPGLIERLRCRNTRLTSQVSQVVRELCGRAASSSTRFLATPLSYATALRLLWRIPPPAVRVPR